MRGIRGAVMVGAVALLALTGCTSNPVANPPTRSVAPVTRAATPVTTPTTPPPTQTAADATPVRKKCGKLVPAAVADAFTAGLTHQTGWAPESDDPSERLALLDGTTCRWSDANGDLLEVSVAKPSSADATRLKNDLVERSQSVPTYGGEAYFQVVDHVGQADVFRGRNLWLFARSNRFFEPGDASTIVATALKSMGYGPAATPTPTPTTPGTPSVTAVPTATPAG